MTAIKYSPFKNPGLIISFILLFTFLRSPAQELNTNFVKRVETYQKQNPQELVYLHTDREIYAAGDQIRFRAYVRDLYSPSSPSISKNLHILLVDQSGNTQQEKIFQLNNKQSEGEFILNNSLSEGEHKLIAWTDGMEIGLAKNVYQKRVFIKARYFPEVIIKLSAGQTRYLPGDLAQIKIELTNTIGKPLKRKKVSYMASYNGASFEAKETKTNKEGKVSIDLALPENDDLGITIVEVAVENMGNTSLNSILVPTSKTPIWLDFAPEGGLFLNGFETQIGFRAYDYLGNAVEIEGELLNQDDKLVKTIKTTGVGFGSFTVEANASTSLKVRLTKPSGIDIDFKIPEVQTMGVQLALESRNSTSLNFTVNTDIKDAAIPLHAVGEMNGNLLFEKRFNLKIKSEFSIPITPNLPSGILKVNLLNRTGQVLAHRSVYLSGKNTIIRQSPTQKKNKKAQLSLIEARIQDSENQAVRAFLSVSVTDKYLAPEWKPVQDIMSWFLLGPSASYAAFPTGFLANPSLEDKKIIDHYMLFQMNNDLDWEKIKTGKTSGYDKTKSEFREELKQFYQVGDFEGLVSQIRQNQFFNRYFIDSNPGFMNFIKENKSTLETLGYFPVKLTSNEQIQQQLANGQSIMNVLKSIKPYKIVNNKIVFRGVDSFNYQGGVIIVIDGVPRGTDPAVLNSISPYDVESLKASASISDIQKYSGLNSTGVIELTTKKGNSSPGKRTAMLYPTIFWDHNLQTDVSGTLSISIPPQTLKSIYKTTVQGVDENGKLLIWINNIPD